MIRTPGPFDWSSSFITWYSSVLRLLLSQIYDLAASFKIFKIVCNVTLIPIVFNSHQVRSADVMMLGDLTTSCETQQEGLSNTNTEFNTERQLCYCKDTLDSLHSPSSTKTYSDGKHLDFKPFYSRSLIVQFVCSYCDKPRMERQK